MGIRALFSRLKEKGRMLSKKNEERLRRMVSEATAILDELDGDGEVSESDRSMHQTMSAVGDAVRVEFGGPSTYAYLEDLFDTTVIFCVTAYSDGVSERVLYQADYTIGDGDKVTFGEPVEVVRRTVYEPVQTTEPMMESGIVGETIPLRERALRSDGTGRIKVIAPGWGSSGYYPPEVLQRDGPLVFPSGTHMYLDHPTISESRELPERSVEDLAAVTTSSAVWEASGPEGAGLYADIAVQPSRRDDLDAIAEHIGVSILAAGTYEMGEAEGKKGRIIKSLKRGDSIDFVTRAGAGGAILPLLESRRIPTNLAQPAPPQEDAMSAEQLAALEERLKKMETENARLRERDLLREAQRITADALSAINLPQPTRTRLARDLANECPITESGSLDIDALHATIKESVNAELAYIGQVAPTGRVRGMGGAPSAETNDPNLEEAFKVFGLSEADAKIAAR